MRARLLPTVAAAVLGLCGAPHAHAQDADACAKFKWSVDRERDAFKGKLPTIRSGADYPGVMSGVTVMLDPQAKVTYPVPPARAPKTQTAFGAVVTAPPLAAKGVYQITVSEPVWIDVVQNGKAHAHRTQRRDRVADQPGPAAGPMSRGRTVRPIARAYSAASSMAAAGLLGWVVQLA